MAILERNDKGAVAHLHMNAPDSLNALSEEMLAALQGQLDALSNDTSIRAVILSGAGKAFCAGHHLKQMTAGRQADDGGVAYFKSLLERCKTMMLSIQALPQPVIAKVHGIATAAGCQLVATCDLAIAADDTRFGVNGVNIGLFCSTPMVALTRNIARKQAFEMLTTGKFIDATRAETLGLINRSVPGDQLDRETDDLAGILVDKLGYAVKVGKQAFYEQLQMPVEQAYDYTSEVIVENLLNRDTIEGIAAFIDKRPPDWTQ